MSEIIATGAGLAGLNAAFDLARTGADVRVLEQKRHVGGRTASWDSDGMLMESGLHRVPAFYREMMIYARLRIRRSMDWRWPVIIRDSLF